MNTGGRRHCVKLNMACFHTKHYLNIKDFIHPNITCNIDHYKKSNRVKLPEFYGCGLRNRNGFNKRVDHIKGFQCILARSKPYWRKTKKKYKLQRVYNTRYKSQHDIGYLAKVKGHCYFNYRTKEHEYQPNLKKWNF